MHLDPSSLEWRPHPRVTWDVLLGPRELRRELEQDVRRGLGYRPRELPPKYFYDARGSQLFDAIFRENAFNGRFGELLHANSPTGAITVPLLIAQGGSDQLVLPALQDRFVAGRCAAGQPIDYRVYPGRDHMSLVAADSPLTRELVAWTQARFRGDKARNVCG